MSSNSDEMRKANNGEIKKPENELRFEVDLPESMFSENDGSNIVKLQFIYSILGLIIGFICIIAGGYLFVRGVSGNSSLLAEILGLKITLSDAAPGAILFCVGVITMWITKFHVSVKKK